MTEPVLKPTTVLQMEAYVPANPAQVFSQVTAFPASGAPDQRLLSEKYGELLEQAGNCYLFQDGATPPNRWRCTFEPPRRRVMQALESTWSDRTDTFEPWGEGARWTLSWELKAQGAPVWLKRLFFRFKDRRRIYQELAQPVIEHFQQAQKREYY